MDFTERLFLKHTSWLVGVREKMIRVLFFPNTHGAPRSPVKEVLITRVLVSRVCVRGAHDCPLPVAATTDWHRLGGLETARFYSLPVPGLRSLRWGSLGSNQGVRGLCFWMCPGEPIFLSSQLLEAATSHGSCPPPSPRVAREAQSLTVPSPRL